MIVATKIVIIVAAAAAMVNASECENFAQFDGWLQNNKLGGCDWWVNNAVYGNGWTCDHRLDYIIWGAPQASPFNVKVSQYCCATCAARQCVDMWPGCNAQVSGWKEEGAFCDEFWTQRDLMRWDVSKPQYDPEYLEGPPGTLLDFCCSSCAKHGIPTRTTGTTDNFQRMLANSVKSLSENLQSCSTGYTNLEKEAVSYYEAAVSYSEQLGECSTAYSEAQEFIANVDEHVEGVESAAHQSVIEATAIKDKYLEVIHDKDATIAQLAQCQNSATTCAGHCGTKNPSGACLCDMFCTDIGDCCNDFQDHCSGSCEGSCGGKSLSGECHCDPDCHYFSDCCSDFAEHC